MECVHDVTCVVRTTPTTDMLTCTLQLINITMQNWGPGSPTMPRQGQNSWKLPRQGHREADLPECPQQHPIQEQVTHARQAASCRMLWCKHRKTAWLQQLLVSSHALCSQWIILWQIIWVRVDQVPDQPRSAQHGAPDAHIPALCCCL